MPDIKIYNPETLGKPLGQVLACNASKGCGMAPECCPRLRLSMLSVPAASVRSRKRLNPLGRDGQTLFSSRRTLFTRRLSDLPRFFGPVVT